MSIIPVRGGNGEMERLRALGHFTPPTLSGLEAALDRCVDFAPTVVTADLWDADRLRHCATAARRGSSASRRINVTGRSRAANRCSACGGQSRASATRLPSSAVGSPGPLMARVLAVLGYDVVLLERGSASAVRDRRIDDAARQPVARADRAAIRAARTATASRRTAAGSSTTRHSPRAQARLHVLSSPSGRGRSPTAASSRSDCSSRRVLTMLVSDTHWLRADVDHHFVREAIAAGVDYRDRAELTELAIDADGCTSRGRADGESFELDADFVIDASGPGGFLARQLAIPSGLNGRRHGRRSCSATSPAWVRCADVARGLPEGPYPEDWAAVHH